ncbi:hypothetical protein TYRP_023214 [Tyrophagus putrescentiae]|nr:hypothetical protein TYRP_023214 [Tyrophagus putrescentiae]
MSGPAAHPDVTWPLSTPSSSGLARCARETLVVDLAALSCALLPPQQLCSPRQPRARTAAITHSKNPKTFCCDSVPRLRTAAKASATSAKTKDNVPNFLGFLVNHKI